MKRQFQTQSYQNDILLEKQRETYVKKSYAKLKDFRQNKQNQKFEKQLNKIQPQMKQNQFGKNLDKSLENEKLFVNQEKIYNQKISKQFCQFFDNQDNQQICKNDKMTHDKTLSDTDKKDFSKQHNNFPQKKDKYIYRFKCFRYIKELINKHQYSKAASYAIVKSCKNYKQFKKKLNVIRDNSKKFKQEEVEKQNQNAVIDQQEDIILQNTEENIKAINNISNLNKDLISEQNQIFEYPKNDTKQIDLEKIINYKKNMFVKENEVIKEITIDPSIIANKNLTDTQKYEYIEKLVDIQNFKLTDENFIQLKKASDSYIETKKSKEQNNKKVKKSAKVLYQEREKQKRLEAMKLKKQELGHLRAEYKQFQWGDARITDKTIQIQGDITDDRLWQDTLKLQNKQTPNQKYVNIIMDPAWPESGCSLGYKTISDKSWMDSIKLPKLQDQGFIGVWVQNKKVKKGIDYIEDNGYKFIELVVWIKVNKLLVVQTKVGYYLLHSVEYCIIGVKAKDNTPIPSFTYQCQSSNLIFAEARLVSQKPDELYEIFEKITHQGPNLEIFGRCHNQRIGWTTVGDESICYKDQIISRLSDYNNKE